MTDVLEFQKLRRGGRVAMRVPVEVRGIAEDGTVFEEATYTAVVGGLGAMIRASRRLQLETDVVVTNRFSQQTADFRVVWLGERQIGALWEIGLESLAPLENFWGVRFSQTDTKK